MPRRTPKSTGHATRSAKPKKRAAVPSNGRAKALANGNGKARAGAHAKADESSNGNGHAPGKRALPVIGARKQIPCLSCGLCCGYVAVEIEPPGTVDGATQILWYLYHHNVSIYADEGEWMVQFETRCQHLLDDKRCSIYETRPPICREYDETACEVNASEVGTSFYNSGEFLTWLAQHHKRVYSIIKKRYMPPEHSLTGQPVSRTLLPSFRPSFDALRSR